jgi:hypothetical protein
MRWSRHKRRYNVAQRLLEMRLLRGAWVNSTRNCNGMCLEFVQQVGSQRMAPV